MKNVVFRGKPPGEKASQVCVLYDPKDGRIVHVHGATAAGDEPAWTKAQLEERIILNAKAIGHSVAGLKILHVPLSAIQQRGVLKVDEKRKTLVVSSPFPPSLRDLAASGQPKKRQSSGQAKSGKVAKRRARTATDRRARHR